LEARKTALFMPRRGRALRAETAGVAIEAGQQHENPSDNGGVLDAGDDLKAARAGIHVAATAATSSANSRPMQKLRLDETGVINHDSSHLAGRRGEPATSKE
jgi:hypothetical protein